MTTPTPGQPLSEADVSLLQPGDWLLVSAPDSFLRQRGFIEGRPVRLRSAEGGWIDLADMPYAQGTSPARFTFLGRPDRVEGERDMSGETFAGFRVAAWRYRQAGETDKLPHHYAEHWSTPGASAWGIQRLFTEDQLLAALTPPAEPVSRPAGEGEREAVAILKGVGKINGDGWKDTTTKGEIVFVWNAEKPSPYAPGQYPRIGNEGWSASTSQYDFTPATADDVPAILSLLSPAAPDAGGVDHADIAARLHPDLFSSDKRTAHRAASPYAVSIKRAEAVAEVGRVLAAAAALQPGGDR